VCDRITRIAIRKADRALVADCVNGAVFTTRVALGRSPVGPKNEMGDMKTPEGLYHITGPREPSRFHGFIPVDYPSVGDAERAVAARRLSREDYGRIVEAHRRGDLPPPDTPLGGMIGIHGQGERWREYSLELDWTFGCVAITDDALDFLADRVKPGIPVEILP